MPNEIRVKPPERSASRSHIVTLSGLDSVVTSTPSASPNSADSAARIAVRSPGGSSVGVPPPRKTVETGRSTSPSTRRACRISAIAASAYVDRLTPSPSSSAV